jgi:hypothetical protein
MNATTAIGLAFLKGDVLTIKTAFRDYGISNLPREASRCIEKKFGVRLAKVRKAGKSRFGIPCSWNEYRLPDTEYNRLGRAKLIDYCQKHIGTMTQCKTEKERTIFVQTSLFLETL